MENKEMINQILLNIGGKDNIENINHCASRLRIKLKNPNLVDELNIKQIPGVITGVFSQNEYHIVIGEKVGDIYAEITGYPSSRENANSFNDRNIDLYSPLRGRIISLSQVSDPAFASGDMGPGLAIDPEGDNILRSPINGRVTVLMETGHSIGITSDNGWNILLHLGLNTVELGGRGFTPLVKVNDQVKQGQDIIHFNQNAIRAAGYELVTPVVVTNNIDKNIELTGVDYVEMGDFIFRISN